MKILKLVIPAIVLALAVVGMVLTLIRGQEEPKPWQVLASRMSLEVDGWVGEDVPLGPNESVLEAVGRLNYNDYVYRIYRKQGMEVSVYAMFWRQGDISVREMSGHTPDGCWVSNGAQHCIEPVRRSFNIGGAIITPPAEVREFLYPAYGERINVAWWHIWGNDLVDRSFAIKSLMPMLKEIKIWLFDRKGAHKDQLLVRIHSSMPIDQAMDTPPARLFVQTLPEVLQAQPLVD